MVRCVFAIAAVISAVLLGLTVLLLVAGSSDRDPRESHLSITKNCHVAVLPGRIEFFNSAADGPYHGSVIELSGRNGDVRPCIKVTGFGDGAVGVYYRHLRWLDSSRVIWTFAINLLYPLVIFAVLPALWMWRRWRQSHHSARETHCAAQP